MRANGAAAAARLDGDAQREKPTADLNSDVQKRQESLEELQLLLERERSKVDELNKKLAGEEAESRSKEVASARVTASIHAARHGSPWKGPAANTRN